MADKRKLGGIVSALVTPFDADGQLDEGLVPSLVDFELRQGIDGLYVGGSTGEAFLQSAEERALYLKAVGRAADGKALLIAHVGAIATAESITLARVAADAGYHAISAVPPFYYDFTAAELTAHFKALAAAVPVPVIVYNFGGKVPKMTGDVIMSLLDDHRFAGIKHTSTDLYQLERFKRHRPDVAIFNGYDEMCLAGLAMGADGAIGTTYNFMGDIFVDLRNCFLAGRMEEALRLQQAANRVIDTLVEVGVFPGTKALMRLMGQDAGECRQPFRGLNSEHRQRLEKCLKQLKADRAAELAA